MVPQRTLAADDGSVNRKDPPLFHVLRVHKGLQGVLEGLCKAWKENGKAAVLCGTQLPRTCEHETPGMGRVEAVYHSWVHRCVAPVSPVTKQDVSWSLPVLHLYLRASVQAGGGGNYRDGLTETPVVAFPGRDDKLPGGHRNAPRVDHSFRTESLCHARCRG